MFITHGAFIAFLWSVLDWTKDKSNPKLGIATASLTIAVGGFTAYTPNGSKTRKFILHSTQPS